MANKLESTITTLQGSLVDFSAKKGAQAIGKWMDELEKEDFRGAKTIHEDLGRLQRELEGDDIDGAKVKELLMKLGESTQRAAGHEEGKTYDGVRQLGEALVNAANGLGSKSKSTTSAKSTKGDDNDGKDDNKDKSKSDAKPKAKAKA